jgi:hypothetical protein
MANEGDILALGDLRVVALQGPGYKLLRSDLPKRAVASPLSAADRRKRTAHDFRRRAIPQRRGPYPGACGMQ